MIPFAISQFRCRLIGVAWLIVASTTLSAAEHYLPDGKPDVVELLAPPPDPGSDEQADDLATTVAEYTKHAVSTVTATAEREVTPATFAPLIGTWFELEKLPKTKALFDRVFKETKQVVGAGKDHWKRPRPYEVDPQLVQDDNDTSPSYPSGHSTQGTVQSLLLAELFPDR